MWSKGILTKLQANDRAQRGMTWQKLRLSEVNLAAHPNPCDNSKKFGHIMASE